MDELALDFLGVLFAHLMLPRIEMPLVGPPAVGVKLRDPERLQQRLSSQEGLVLPPTEHRRQDREHSVILTLSVAAVDDAQTPARRSRYIWHSGVPTSGCC
jgi:hypothetical protein